MESISRLIARAYPRREPEEIAAMRAFSWWCKAVPSRVVKNARPVRLKRGVLMVHTTTSAWANTLQYESEEFLGAILKHAPEAKISKIRFRVGPLPNFPLVAPPQKTPPPPRPLAEFPDSVARELAKIADDEVRDTVARAVATGLAAGASSGRRKR